MYLLGNQRRNIQLLLWSKKNVKDHDGGKFHIFWLWRYFRTLDYDHTPDHTYNFTVVATDNGSPPNNGSATVRVTVTNVNDEDPVFMQSIEHVQVSEDASRNTVVHVVQAYDPDGDDVTYSFLGKDSFTQRESEFSSFIFVADQCEY